MLEQNTPKPMSFLFMHSSPHGKAEGDWEEKEKFAKDVDKSCWI
jgi:hypothetical protein